MKKTLLILTIICLSLVLQACSSDKEKFAVVDKNKVLQQSNYYKQVQALEQQLVAFEEKLAVQKEQNQAKLIAKEQELNNKMQAAMNAKIKQKQDQLQVQLNNNNKDFLASKEQEMRDFVNQINKQFNDKLLDYEQRLSQEQISQLEGEIKKEKQQLEQQIKDKDQQILKQIEDKLSGERAVLSKELDTYVANEQAVLQEQMKNEFNTYTESLLGTDEVEKNKLEKQHQDLIVTIGKKMDETIAKIAKEKNISVVFTQVVANVEAIDLNKEIVEALNKQ